MFRNNPVPSNMRFPPPPLFPPVPPITNQSFPMGWAHPPIPPPIPYRHPQPWNNPTMRLQQGNGFDVNRNHFPTGISSLPYIPQNVTTPLKTPEERDREWIENFLKRCTSETSTCSKGQKAKLSEAKQLHLKAYKLLNMLQDGCQSESAAKSSLDSTAKKELDEILRLLKNDEYVKRIAAAALRRKSKRARTKIKRQEDFNREVELQDRIKERHMVVDKWLEDRKKVEDDLKRERKVRKDLDEYLSDIRQKQQNAQRYLDIFNAMAKLRKARCETAVRKGKSPPPETHNDVFKTAHNSACKRLREFISGCKSEENFMRKYLTEEHEAEERRIQDKLKEEKEKKVTDWKAERSQVLFGSEDDLDPLDPSWPVREIHCQGTRSLVGLVNIRTQWDQFISNSGSRIPTHWVEPPAPSSDEWQNYMSTS